MQRGFVIGGTYFFIAINSTEKNRGTRQKRQNRAGQGVRALSSGIYEVNDKVKIILKGKVHISPLART